jgi:hypothetical protein
MCSCPWTREGLIYMFMPTPKEDTVYSFLPISVKGYGNVPEIHDF